MPLKVCTLLVNYRNALEISKAVASVLADDASEEIAVVDNSDDDREWMHLNDLLPKEVTVVRAPTNLGFGAGCNLGLAHSDAELVFLVNPDVQVLPQCTRILKDALENDPALGAVSPRQFLDVNKGWVLPASWLPTRIRAWATERARYEPHTATRLARAAHAERSRFVKAKTPIRQRALSGAALMVRRSALLKHETLFDSRYFMYFEDTDLCMRLRKRGWKLAVVPQATAVHAWRNEAHKGPMMASSAAIYFDKFFPPASSWMPSPRIKDAGHPSTVSFELFPQEGILLPSSWLNDWMLEISPDPLLDPVITHIGKGLMVEHPARVLEHFNGANVYGRISRISLPFDSTTPRFYWPGSFPAANANRD